MKYTKLGNSVWLRTFAFFSDELDNFYIKQNKCLIYYYGYGKILLWRRYVYN